MNTDNEIRAVKLGKRFGATVEYRYQETAEKDEVIKTDVIKSIDSEPHHEAFTALKLLLPHLVYLTEQSSVKVDAAYLKSRRVINDTALEKFVVTGFAITGEGEETTAVIFGKKHLAIGDPLPLKTNPVTLYGKSKYEFSGNLAEDIENAQDAFIDYIGGKITPKYQLEMDI